MTEPSGNIYEGNFDEGLMKGQGTCTLIDGVVLSGDWS